MNNEQSTPGEDQVPEPRAGSFTDSEIPGQQQAAETEPVGSYITSSTEPTASGEEAVGAYVQSEIPGETAASDDGEVGHFTDTDPA